MPSVIPVKEGDVLSSRFANSPVAGGAVPAMFGSDEADARIAMRVIDRHLGSVISGAVIDDEVFEITASLLCN